MSTLDFEHVLSTTRSVRRRLDFERPIPPEVIEAAIDLAVQAPTGAGREGWRFLVITDPERKLALADLYRRAFARWTALRTAGGGPSPRAAHRALAERLHEVPALILACVEGRPEPGNLAQQVALYGSILPAAWSLMLALRARGLGSTWTTLHLAHEREAAAALGIPDGVTQTVLLPVGYLRDAKLAPAKRRPAREVTYWNAWGARRTPSPADRL
jgi:nitroreductase